MANQEHLDILKQGVDVWNKWRQEHQRIKPDLSNADLRGARLRGVNLRRAHLFQAYLDEADFYRADLFKTNLRGARLNKADLLHANLREADLRGAYLNDGTCLMRANLSRAVLSKAYLNRADLRETFLRGTDFSSTFLLNSSFEGAHAKGANLKGAYLVQANLKAADFREADLSDTNLSSANLRGTDLRGTDLKNANLRETNLSGADLSGADLSGADLSRTTLIGTNLTGANLVDCSVYGISAWDVQLQGTKQFNLVITLPNQPTITVDNLEVAQFIYLLLNNERIRHIIDTITSKVVLILGRFIPERKAVLDALRDELRKKNYLPILFDFDKPSSRDLTETVSTLAHLARFVIADITDAKSIPQELKTIVPNLPSVPVQPLILKSQHEYGMFEHFTRFPWVLPVHHYIDEGTLLLSLKECIIDPAERKAQELAKP